MKTDDLAGVIEAVLAVGLTLGAALLCGGLVLGSASVLQWGIQALMLTPVARVVVLTVGLFHERDWPFGLLSMFILGVLGVSMLLGARLF